MNKDEKNSDVRTILQKKGINITTQRLEMAEYLFQKNQHLTAEQIFQEVNQKFPSASRATVFNNLKTFVEKGLLRQLEIHSGTMLYDSNVTKHHHVIDENTGEIFDVEISQDLEDKIVSEIQQDFETKTGRVMKDSSVVITFHRSSN